MNNPEVILRTLDRHLSEPARLILYGRAALALGFDDTPPHFGSTKDVDAILPEVEMSAIEEDDSFWNAIEETNKELESTGFYLTHLFSDSQVNSAKLVGENRWNSHGRLQPPCTVSSRHRRPHANQNDAD
jgi:hypothetical protein